MARSSHVASFGAPSAYALTMRASSASALARSAAFQTARSWRPMAFRAADDRSVYDRDDMATELDPERYPPERHGYIVDMMQEPEIGLCFRLPGQGERWLMPECLPKNAPDIEAFFGNALRFRFCYDFLPIGLVPRFIVEAYNKFTEQPTRWRTGALLAAAGCKVLVKADMDKNRIDLAVTGPETRRRSALEAVLHDLETVHKLNPEIVTEARVPLPDDPEVDVGYADLLKWEDAEGPDYSFWPEKAKRKYTVGELLAGVRVDGGRRVMPELVVPPTAAAPSQGSPVAGGFRSRAVLRRWRWSCCSCSSRRTSCGQLLVACSARASA
jgi:hypothetical protein